MKRFGIPVAKRSPIAKYAAAAALAAVSLALSTLALAQASASAQCGEYVEAYKSGPSEYSAYLQAAAAVAKSRDAQGGVATYSKALAASAPSANALWLNNWCAKNPLKGFTEASSRLLDELTGRGVASSPSAPPAPPQVVVVAPAQPLQPSACRVGDVGNCSGCAVSCGNGSQAKCKPGRTGADGNSCAFQAKCQCEFEGNSGPPPGAENGVSSCRVGSVESCSGCSVTCNGGKTAVCKPGTAHLSGNCAFQAKCTCQ